MTFQEIYNEILLRAGEGYDAYQDRAKESFWKAVSLIINNGEYTDTEIRKLIQRHTANITNNDFNNNRWCVYNIWGAGSTIEDTDFMDNEVFDYKIMLNPISPENMKFHEVPIDKLRDTAPLDRLSQAIGIPELIYAFDMPDLYITNSATSFSILVSWHSHSIPRTIMNDPTTNADHYMNYGFIVRAIETAVNLLKTETE